MKNLVLLFTFLSTFALVAQTTYVPDDNFENHLETHNASGNVVPLGDPNSMGNGIANDNYVFTNRINTVTSLDVSGLGINDLTGIEGFIALINLDCSENTIGSLDVSSNTALEVLDCSGITDLLGNETFNISSLTLGTINNLKTLDCSLNNLSALDVSNQTGLINLNCSKNNIGSLNLSTNTLIETLDCSGRVNIDIISGVIAIQPTISSLNLGTISSLKILNVGANNLSSLSLTNLSQLQELYCATNTLSSLDVSNNTALTKLYCNGLYYYDSINSQSVYVPNISTLNLGSVNSIVELNCSNNNLSSLDVSNVSALKILNANSNNLTSLDVSNNPVLEELYCSSKLVVSPTKISSFNIGSISNLKKLYCQDNEITTLYLQNNTNLTEVYCKNNNLEFINIKNGTNNVITTFDATGNTGIVCLQVDDATAANAGTGVYTTWQKDASVSYSENCLTYVPDDNFENYLETHDANGNVVTVGAANSMGNGIANDNYVFTNRIDTVTNLNVSNQTIADLTGIEDFTALQLLDCSFNSLSSLDFSSNTALTILYCQNNNLNSLDVSSNTALSLLNCGVNNLSVSGLDISSNTALTSLICISNNLSSLDVSSNTALTSLYCHQNNLNSFDVSSNTALTTLSVTGNQISYLDLSTNVNLIDLFCSNNQLTGLSVYYNNSLQRLFCDDNQISNLILPNQSTSLQKLICDNNNIPSLDVSGYSNLTQIICNNNSLTQLNVKNGNNTNIINADFNATNNPNLTCIQVDDAAWSLANWSNIDAGAGFSANCGYNDTFVPDDNFESYLETHDANGNVVLPGDPNSMGNGVANDNFVTTAKINTVTQLDISNLSISDVTGIQDFTALTNLNCANNSISVLDLGQNTSLAFLDCSNNNIPSLNLLGNISLQAVTCNNNNMDDLNIAPNSLAYLYCQNNSLQQLDLSQMYNLIEVVCNNNQISNLDVINSGANLSVLQCNDNQLTGINTDANVNLIKLYCQNNAITSLNLTTNTTLEELDCSDNNLTTLNVTQNTQLGLLYCSANSLTALNVTQNTNLTELKCNVNQLSSLDVSQNTQLDVLDCTGNQISQLNTAYLPLLTQLYCGSNQLTSIDVSANTILIMLWINGNQIETLDLSNNAYFNSLLAFDNPNLYQLDIKNGNNSNQSGSNFNISNCPLLTCVQVDDVAYSDANWTNKDPQTYYNTNCPIVTVWIGGSWINGAPDLTKDAIIRDNYASQTNGNIDAFSLFIENGKTLTIDANTYLKTQNNIIIDGSLIVEHEGSVLQIDNFATVTNNGNIEVKKTMDSFDDGTDFAILGSPMSGTTRNGAYALNNVVMNHITSNFIPNPDVENLDPTSENFADDNGDNWEFYLSDESIVPGLGYLVGGVTGGGTFTNTYNQGSLNNGVIDFPIVYNGTQNASPNILSNPYASAINADTFITDNTLVDAVYFWEHLTVPTSSYPGYRSENWDMGDISMYNLSGGIAASNGGVAPTQFIPSGQGFGIKANNSGIVAFSNSQRVTGPNTGYRNSITIERLYLNLHNNTYNLNSNTLVAFTSEATDGIDENYDAKRLATPVSIYSIVEEQELSIQGRSEFTTDQVIKLGFRTQVEELQQYTISISNLEGENLAEANVFLIDNLLHITTNLTETDYTFQSENGNFKDRFVIVFNNTELGVEDVLNASVSVYPNPTKEQLTVFVSEGNISSIKVFDLLGREVIQIQGNQSQSQQINLSHLSNAVYFVEIKTPLGKVVKRIIKK